MDRYEDNSFLFGLPMVGDPVTTFWVYFIPVLVLAAVGIVAAVLLERRIRQLDAVAKLPGIERP